MIRYPNELPGLAFDFDMDQSKLVLVNDEVSELVSASNIEKSVTSTKIGKHPFIHEDALTGKWCLRYTEDDYLAADYSNTATITDFTVYVCSRPPAVGEDISSPTWGNAQGTNWCYRNGDGNFKMINRGYGISTKPTLQYNQPAQAIKELKLGTTDTTPKFATQDYDGAVCLFTSVVSSTEQKLFWNGFLRRTFTEIIDIDTSDLTDIVLGATNDNGYESLKNDHSLFQVVVYEAYHDEEQVLAMNRYLAKKWESKLQMYSYEYTPI